MDNPNPFGEAMENHLRDVLDGVADVIQLVPEYKFVGKAIAEYDDLKEAVLLCDVAPDMPILSYVSKVGAAFQPWTHAISSVNIDQWDVAKSIQDCLFVRNPVGWERYIKRVRRTIPWFAERLPPVTAKGESDRTIAGAVIVGYDELYRYMNPYNRSKVDGL